MSESLVVCDVAEDLVEKLRKFRFRKETNNAAIIMKIDKDKRLVVLDEELEGISPDELKDELPERQPRFIVYSYKYQHDDGRVSYPLCFIFSSPVGCKPEQQMMYAGSKNKLVQTAELTKACPKVLELRHYNLQVTFTNNLIESSPQLCKLMVKLLFLSGKTEVQRMNDLPRVVY
ncbi:glia maturation factor beta isoform X2 [Tursiops truncatus]|uniref:Glia maturation factor beta n=2 Tax=Delphinidae TaxID=9726 RepID=A0A6J3QWZ4_TURTR|nr:glia maturation factor beta isoform X2 [Tursiops truncatus]